MDARIEPDTGDGRLTDYPIPLIQSGDGPP